MTDHLYPVQTPIHLPRLGSWPEAVHIFDEASVFALEAAEAAGRPLLVRGDPGVGKSQLARAAAVARERLFLFVVVHAQTTSQDLQWQFDAVSRLGEAQLLAHAQPGEATERLHPRRFLSPGPLWWAFDWASAEQQWRACAAPPEPMPLHPVQWRPGQGSVLLIDEIDKADSDLPNGLLETLGNGDFTVPYVGGSVRQFEDAPPLVIITTNEERELPDAFLRRCLVLPLGLPSDDDELLDFLCQRGAVHFGTQCHDAVRRAAADLLLRDRNDAVAQGALPPGQAEYLDLLRAVCRMAQDEAAQLGLLDKISQFVLNKAPAR